MAVFAASSAGTEDPAGDQGLDGGPPGVLGVPDNPALPLWPLRSSSDPPPGCQVSVIMSGAGHGPLPSYVVSVCHRSLTGCQRYVSGIGVERACKGRE